VNTNFDFDIDFSKYRDGSEKEIQNLVEMTSDMGLSQWILRDKASYEVKQILNDLFSAANNSGPQFKDTYDFLFIAFSSHGNKDGVQFRDNIIVPYTELVTYLTSS
uniref:caspase family protein n=1 Tax=Salmonella sp. s51228 TaxID=3159652 RepID=UPI003980DF45